MVGLLLAAVGRVDVILQDGAPVGHNWSMWLMAGTGAVLAVVGLVLYRSERLQG